MPKYCSENSHKSFSWIHRFCRCFLHAWFFLFSDCLSLQNQSEFFLIVFSLLSLPPPVQKFPYFFSERSVEKEKAWYISSGPAAYHHLNSFQAFIAAERKASSGRNIVTTQMPKCPLCKTIKCQPTWIKAFIISVKKSDHGHPLKSFWHE